MKATIAPIPYAVASPSKLDRALFLRPLPDSIAALLRYHAGDEAFPPPHWVRMRAPRDAAIGERLVAAWTALTALVEADARPDLPKAWAQLALDAKDPVVQTFAADAIESGRAPDALTMLYAAASQGRGERFDALFARAEVPIAAHLLRLSALNDHGGMPWSDAFANALRQAIGGTSVTEAAIAWALRLVSELRDPRARRFLDGIAATATERLRSEIALLLTVPPTSVVDVDDDPLPTSMDGLELGALDPRRPERRVPSLSRMAALDWPRARRLASAITTEDWQLDELIGALLNHMSLSAMADDFVRRGLIAAPPTPPTLPSARELMRNAGKVVRFDTTSIEGIVDHDRLAYTLVEAMGQSGSSNQPSNQPSTQPSNQIDFLEEYTADHRLLLHAWDGPRSFMVELDTSRSVIDPYGLVGLVNVVMRERGRPERGLLAAENKGMCDVVVGPESALREIVDAGLLWIRAGFKW